MWEAFRALKSAAPGFAEEIARLERLGMRFAIFRNRKNVGVDGFERGGVREIRIVPVIAGTKRGGVLQTVIGVVLIAAATFVTGGFTGIAAGGAWGAAGATGITMAAGAVVQMLSPS